MPKKKPVKIAPQMKIERPKWKWADGWRAAGWSVLCAEAILAGGDRPCMPSFNLDNLLGDMLAMHAVGVAEVLALCTAVPAFVVAANPWSSALSPNRRIVTIIPIALVALNLQLFFNTLPIVWLPVFGVIFGLMIRWFPWVRTNWIAIALVSAVALGVVQFSGLQYSHIKCWR